MGRLHSLCFSILLGLAVPLSAEAAGYRYVSFLLLPGAPTGQYVSPTGINDDGIIVGNVGTEGFIFADKATSYVAIPNATMTTLEGIDRVGAIIGYTYTELLNQRVGFSFSDVKGVIKAISGLNGKPVTVGGFNSHGKFVSFVVRNRVALGQTFKSFYDPNFEGYSLYAPKEFSAPGASSTIPEAINDHDEVVGIFYDSNGEHSFIYDYGGFVTIDVPGGIVTVPRGINNIGTIVGTYYDPNQNGREKGFVLKNGAFTTIDFPGAQGGTHVSGISEGGAITGYYYDNVNIGYTGFVARPEP